MEEFTYKIYIPKNKVSWISSWLEKKNNNWENLILDWMRIDGANSLDKFQEIRLTIG